MSSKVYQWVQMVSAADIDELGHTNNAAYIRFCEAAAWAHSAALGLTVEDYHRIDRAMAITRAEYDYHKPSFKGEELLVDTWLSDCDGRATMRRNFRVSRQQQVIVSGHWQLCCIRLSSGKIARLPAEFKDFYLPAITDQL